MLSRTSVCLLIIPTLALVGIGSFSLDGTVDTADSYAASPPSTGQPSVQDSDNVSLAKRLEACEGNFAIPPGEYTLTEPLLIDLTKHGAVAIHAQGPVRLIMSGPGPAIRIVGSHKGSADPKQFLAKTRGERMPLIDGLEIIGAHDEADGIELSGTMQATVTRTTVRNVRHAIRLTKRNRNVVISHVHLYDNHGIGVYLDDVNLHQINIGDSHISYNWMGGIVVRGGNVRNLQITGCDIEANMPNDPTPTDTANVLLDCTPLESSIAEIAITGCTIQHYAHYHPQRQAPGGANIRVIGREDYQPNMIAITGNILSDTSTHVHCRYVSDVTLVGNTFFTTEPLDVLIESSQRVVISSSAFNPRESTDTGQILLRDSTHCLLNGLTLHNMRHGKAALTLQGCQECSVSDCIISRARHGIELADCRGCTVRDCIFSELDHENDPVFDESQDNRVDLGIAH